MRSPQGFNPRRGPGRGAGEPKTKRFVFGPGGGAKVAARFRRADPVVLCRLAEEVRSIMREDPVAKDVREDWRKRLPVLNPEFDKGQARNAGVTRKGAASG